MQLKLPLISLVALTSVALATEPSTTTATVTETVCSYPVITTITVTAPASSYYPTATTTVTVTGSVSYCPTNTTTVTVTGSASSCPSTTPTTIPTPVCPPFSQTIPLRRMWSAQLTDHFYSTYGPEVASFGPQGYVEETPPGRVYAAQANGTVPLWRCISNAGTNIIDHFYTADVAEFQAQVAAGCQIMPDPAAGGISQGIGYLYTAPLCGSIPLYRMWSGARVDHFYTTDTTERQNLLDSGVYVDQGITGYVIPSNGA